MFDDLDKYHVMKNSITPWYPLKTISVHFEVWATLLPNMSKCSQTWYTCSNGLIMHLDKMAQVGEKYILIKAPQNPSCPEPNLNNSTLPCVSFRSEFLWTCSNPQMMTLHQVVHQGEWICMTRSWKTHFCWFLGFTKVTLATFPKWAQIWWHTLFLSVIPSC